MRSFFYHVMALLLGGVCLDLQPARAQAPPQTLTSQAISGGHWQLTWNSIAGERYILERSSNLVQWTAVGTVDASGPTASLTDTGVQPAGRIFWRVRQVPVGPDTTPPSVSIVSARYVTQGGQTALELSVTATDNIGVVAVNFSEGGVQLGAATASPAPVWRRIVPLNANDTNPRSFRASAGDAAGNAGLSPFFTYVPGSGAPRFLPLTGSGDPLSQGLLGLDQNGDLLPFIYSPAGNGGNSPQNSLLLQFPEGGRVIQVDGRDTIQSNHLTLTFGPESPLQFPDGPLVRDLSPGENTLVPLGEMTIAQLLATLDRPVEGGLEVLLFGKFRLRLLNGTITESGILSPEWDFSALGLPLPERVAPWAAGTTDLLSGKEAVFPIAGVIPLPGLDGTTGPQLVIGRDRPLLLTLRPDCSIGLNGRADLEFPGGARFGVEISLDDPNYCFTLRAESLTLPLASSLADLLPGNAAGCVPAVAQPVAMDTADLCLRAYLRAYRLFAREAEALGPVGPEDGFRRQPSNPDGAASAIADALAASLATPVALNVPVQPLRDLAAFFNGTAVNSPDSGAPAAVLAAIQRLEEALASIPAGPGEIPPDVRAEIQAAASAAARTIIRHAQESVRAGSLPAIQKALEDLSIVDLSAGGFLDEDLRTGVATARNNLATQWITGFALPLGIVSSSAGLTTELNALDRFAALQRVTDLVDFSATLQLAGLTVFPGSELLAPCRRLLLLRAFQALQQQFEAHLVEENVPASLLDLADLSGLVADAALMGAIDPAFPDNDDILARLNAISVLIDRELTLPRGERTFFDLAAKTRALLEAARVLPAALPAAQSSMQRLHAALAAALTPQLTNEVALANLSPDGLFHLLQAGALYTRLGTRFGLTNSLPWEGQHLVNVTGLLAAAAESANAWPLLHNAALFLLDEANAIKNSPVQTPASPAARRLYQVQAARVLEALHTTALKVWELSAAERAKSPPATLADAFLPGDLRIDRVTGGFCFNRLTGAFEGTFGGQLRLPKFNGALTISQGRFTSSGEFEIEAHGHLDFPPPPLGGQAFVSADIPASQPVRLSYSVAGGLRFSGSMRVAMSNGVTFTAAAAFLDPVYSFRFEAAGLNFDVLQAISSSLPGFPSPGGAMALTYNEEKLGRWADLYAGFGAAAEQATDGGGQARDDHDGPSSPSPDSTYQSLRGWLAARELTDAGPPDQEVRDRVTEYFAQQMRELIAQNALIDQLGGDPFAATASGAPPAARAPRGGAPPVDALQFDFGPGGQFNAAGPAHSTGAIPAPQLTWNYLSADTAGGLLKTDGSAFAGAGLDFGKFPLLDDRNINWSAATVPVVLPAGGGSIYGDGTASFASFHETDNTGVAVRLTGLPAGAWRVFVPYSRMPFRVAAGGADMTPGQLIRAGRERPSAPAAERLALQMPVSLEKIVASSTQWTAGDNFATWLVDLSAGDNLVITSIGNGLRRTGFLQGLQLVRVPVAIEEFSVNPVSPLEGLSKGAAVTIHWRVRNASSLDIQPGIGPLAALEGQIVVNATQSTQYVLTARNASGETTAVVSVVIAGQPDTKGLESALEDIAEKLGDLGDILDDPATAGENFDSAQLEKFFCDPAGVDLGDIVRQRVLGNESLKQDFGAVKNAIKTGLDVQAIASLLGVECLDDLMNDIVAFVDDGIEIHERKMGKNANGTVDAVKVAGFTAEQSRVTMTSLIDVYANMQSLGSDRVLNDALLTAHADNERRKLLAGTGYQPGPPVVTAVDEMEPEDVHRIAAALLDNAERLEGLNNPLPPLPDQLWGILGLAIESWAHLELSVTPRNQWRSLLQWIGRVQTADTLLTLGQVSGSFPSNLEFFGRLALDALAAEGLRMPDADALRLLEMLLRPAVKRALGQPPVVPPDPALAETWEEVAENFLIHISGLIDEPLTDESTMTRAGVIADKLGQVGKLVNAFRQAGGTLEFILLTEPAHQLARLSDAFDTAARARDAALKLAGDRKGRAALMFLRGSITGKITRAAESLRVIPAAGRAPRGGTDTPVRASLRSAFAAMSADAAELAAEIAGQEAPDGLGDFGVPGGLIIERLGGSLYYNRDTGYLRGGLTGRLTMPDNGFFLDVREASLDSNGSYTMDLTTGGTVPLGGSSKLLFEVDTLAAEGTPGGSFSFSGAASLRFDGSPQPGDEFALNVSTGFDSNTGLLAIGTDINSPLKFSDDVVLLDGSVDVEFSTTHPAGALVLDGKLGLLSRGNPRPPGTPPDEDDFLLVLDINPTAFRFSETDFTVRFTGGTLTLAPELFSSEVNGQQAPASVALAGTLCLRYDFATRQIEFCDINGQPFTLALSNLKLALQEIPGFELLINSATLELSGTQFPVLKNLAANFQFPLPGMDATNAQQNRLVSIDVTGKDWRIDGFPREVSFALAQNLRIADLDGLDVDLLGGTALPGCATTFSLTSQEVGGQQQIQIALNGGMRVAFEQKLLDNAGQPGTAVAATACGSFTWDFESLPVLNLSTAQIEGRFALGGPNGIRIGGLVEGTPASLTFIGIENLHRLTGLSPFTVGFTGAMEVANFVKFGLKDANLKWDGTSLIPVVTLGGAQTSLGSEAVALAQGFLPVYPTSIGVEFLNSTRPLFPAVGEMGLFDPLNIRLLLSGVVSIPPPVAEAPGGGSTTDLPGLGGSVDNLGINLVRQGNDIVPNFSLNGLGLKLSGVDVPPLGGLNGSLYVGNLNDPANLYFAGSVGGTVNDVGAKISMGVHRSKGLLGAVFDLDIGPAGIPLDGGALGGILLTGGSGGLSFGNTFAQPADFLNSIQFSTVNGEKQPVNDGAPDAFPPTGAPSPLTYPASPPAPDTQNSCINGTFPPPTINPLCKPHPAIAGRIIFKGTNLHPTTPNNDLGIPLTLNSLGITPATVPGTLNGAVTYAVQQITQPVRNFANGLINAVPPVVDAKVKAYYASLLNKQLRQLETSATGFLTQALGQAIGLNPNASLYQAVVDAAAKGIPCLDATLRLQGNFSHAAVSTVLKGKGAVTVSTTGTATLDGSIELIGIPVGEGVLALSITDTQGNINPSFGGVLHAGVGPLTLGDMSMAYECNGCFTAVLNSFQIFLATNVETMGAASRQLLVEMMNRTVPVSPARSLNGDPGAFFVELTDAQKMAFVANLFNIVQLLGDGKPLPPGITVPVVSGFITSFQKFVSDVLLEVNPRFCFQAKVKPAIFGFPLIPGPTALDARFAYEKVHDQALNQDFQQLSANTVFSPAFIMGALTTGGYGALLPASDQVNAGFSFRVPAFTPATVDLAMRNPAQFALNQFSTMVQDSTLTFGYAFMPLGIPLAEGQARMIMPRLINHPSNPGRPRGFWEAPAPAPFVPPTGTTLATRDEVIIAALVRGRLQDPNWRGIRGELDDLFFQPFDPVPPPGTPQDRVIQTRNRLNSGQMNQLGFAEDYFPHGGIIGASQLQLPKVIADALPADLIAKVFNPANPTWLADAQNLFNNYLTANTVVGQMAAYIPAPNVPQGFNFATGSPQELIDSLITGNPLAILNKTAPAGVYPFDQVTLAGWMKAQILGMPLGDASVRFDAATGTFKAQAGITPGSWLTKFLNGSAELEIRKPAILSNPPTGATIDAIFAAMPRKTVQQRFQELQATLATANVNTVIATIQDTLPKARVEVGATLQLPPELGQFIQAQGAAGAQFFAFSPGYDRNFQPANFSPYALAQRRGGLGFRGHFKVGYAPNGTELFMVDVQDASFAITPPGVGVPFPGLAAQLELGPLQLPGLPRFSNAHVAFNSTPDNGAPFVDIGGVLDPFSFQVAGVNLLTVQALSGGTLSGHLRAYRDDAIPVIGSAAEFSISAARASMPMLGNVAVTMFGEENGGNYTDFSFSTQSGQAWAASIVISSDTNSAAPPTFQIRSPLAPAGTPALMEFTATSRVFGSISGNGLNDFRLELDVPVGFSATFFPGQETEVRTPVIGGTQPVKIYLDRTGRFYVDLGQLTNLGLPGILTASGRLEFGYNPNGAGPSLTGVPSGTRTFPATDILNQSISTFTVTNTGNEQADVTVTLKPFTAGNPAPVQHFHVNRPAFPVAPGQSVPVDILFHPATTGAKSGRIEVFSKAVGEGGNDQVFTFALSGSGVSTPVYFQSSDTIHFGDTIVGGNPKATLTVGNKGSQTMTSTLGVMSGAGYTVTPATAASIPPGGSRLYTITFEPTAIQNFPGTLTITTGNAGGPYLVNVSGAGSESRWVTLMDSASAGTTATLNDITFLDANRGFVAGDNGTFYETRDRGRSWTPRALTVSSLKDIAVNQTVFNDFIAEYHLDLPQGARIVRDDGPNGYHGGAPSAAQAPLTGTGTGAIGGGLAFDGVDDCVDLGVFDLPSNFAIAFYFKPFDSSSGQCLIGKHSSAGGNQFLFGYFNNVWQLNFRGQVFEMDIPSGMNGSWNQMVLNASYDQATDKTNITLWMRGLELLTIPFNGPIGTFGGGKPWTLGQDWDSSTVRSDFFQGGMDEVYFFDGTLADNEIQALSVGSGGQQVLLTGSDGTVLESGNRGLSFHVPYDMNTSGWRHGLGVFRDYDWTAAAVTGASKIVLGGVGPGATLAIRNRLLLLEDLDANDPGFTGDDRYDEVTFDGTADSAVSNSILALFRDNSLSVSPATFALSGSGRIYRTPASGNVWTAHGTVDVAGALRAGISQRAGIASNAANIAVGDGGAVVTWTGTGTPTQVPAANVPVTANLRAASSFLTQGTLIAPRYHAAGDGGAYIVSTNAGSNWTEVQDGLTADVRGMYARHPGSPSASTTYESWVVGTQHTIQHRPWQRPTGSFVAFQPGLLDFGYTKLGTSRVQEVRVFNRGRKDLSLNTIQVTGAGFSLGQVTSGTVSRIAPGDSVTLQVRYQPGAVSAFDAGDLTFGSNDTVGQIIAGLTNSFRVPLRGRCDNPEWLPVPLTAAGVPVDGEVLEVVMVTETTGYALVGGTGDSRVFKTTNGGAAWTAVTLTPPAGQAYVLQSLDAKRISFDCVLLAGERRNSSNAFVSGVVLRSVNGGNSFSDVTPSGDTGRPFGSVTQYSDSAGVLAAASQGSGADVWYSSNSGVAWAVATDPPTSSYSGGKIALVATPLSGAVPVTNNALLLALRTSSIFGRTPATQWPWHTTGSPAVSTGRPKLSFKAASPINDIQFGERVTPSRSLNAGWLCGNGGLFYRGFFSTAVPVDPFSNDSGWVPCENQEVIGRTDLTSVHFHDDSTTGWMSGGSRIFVSADRGETWEVDFDAGEGALLKSIASRKATAGGAKGWAGGSLGGRAVIWRYVATAVPALPSLLVKDVEIFPSTTPGGLPRTVAVNLQNTGTAELRLHNLHLKSDDPANRFRINGTPPASVPANGSTNISVTFDPLPDPVNVPALTPNAFLRFDQNPGDLLFLDSSTGVRHAARTAGTPATNDPAIATEDGRRDPWLQLDGGDSIEVGGGISDNKHFSVSLWVNPSSTADGQTFIGKHSSAGSDQFLLGFFAGGYQIKLNTLTMTTAGLKKTGWQHLAVTAELVDTAITKVSLWRDGELLLTQTLATAVATFAGKLWSIGADWDSASALNEFLTGGVDDAGIFDRILTEGEIAALAGKSALCGEHRAQLVFNTDSDNGARVVELRAVVDEVTRLVVIDTQPKGLQVTVDGQTLTTPVAVAVRCRTSDPAREWLEGSAHRLTIPAGAQTRTDANGNVSSFEFASWSRGAGSTITVPATYSDEFGTAAITANFALASVTAPAPPPPPAPPGAGVIAGDNFNIETAFTGTPRGPFIRLTGGEVSVPQLGATGFEMEGNLFVSLTKVRGSLTTMAITWPQTGSQKFLDVGASNWQLDMVAGSHLLLKARPPSVKIFGRHVAPDGELALSFERNAGADGYAVQLNLNEDFRLVENFLEFKKGGVLLDVTVPQSGLPGFIFTLSGGLRVLRLPDAAGDADGWAFNVSNAFTVNTNTFAVSLAGLIGQTAPMTIFNFDPFRLTGDLTLRRNATGPVFLGLSSTSFVFNGTPLATVSGSVSTDTTLTMSGTIPNSLNFPVGGNSAFSLRNSSGGGIGFTVRTRMLPEPQLELEVPSLKLLSNAPGFPSAGLTLPGITFDSSGDFSTGKLPLPSWRFEGIDLSRPSGGAREDNYIRLRRVSGDIKFDARSELPFLPGCPLHDASFTFDGSTSPPTVTGSYRGKFCVLSEMASLEYDSDNAPFQFRGTIGDFIVYFGGSGGTVMAGVKNKTTGVCILGECP